MNNKYLIIGFVLVLGFALGLLFKGGQEVPPILGGITNFDELDVTDGYRVDNTSVIGSTGQFTPSGTVTVGSDGSGFDVTMFGETAGLRVLWDASTSIFDVQGAIQILDTNSTTTLFIGNSGATGSGCIVMGDSDDGGISYITVLNGVVSATTTQPSSCQ